LSFLTASVQPAGIVPDNPDMASGFITRHPEASPRRSLNFYIVPYFIRVLLPELGEPKERQEFSTPEPSWRQLGSDLK
jgi:hypothetical protein